MPRLEPKKCHLPMNPPDKFDEVVKCHLPMNPPDKFDEVVKILVIGDATVGKTSFIYRYADNSFKENYKTTIICDFLQKELKEHGGRPMKIKVQLWDIAGQERFRLLTRSFYRYARGCIIMFDLTDTESFQKVREWKETLDANTADEYYAPIPCLLVGNKTDLSPQIITDRQIEETCRKLLFVQWTQTSVKDGTNVNEAVRYLLDVVLGKSPNTYTPTEYELIDHVHLADYVEEPRKKSCRTCT